MTRQLFSLLLPGLLMLALPACATPLTYSAKEIHGQIVDAETNQPIEGAVIVAQWILFEMGIGHGGHKSRIHIHETVTDQNGNYTIPAWGPKLHSPITMLDREDPMLLIFKSGYAPQILVNSIDRSDAVRISEWDGRVVKLKKFQGTLEAYANQLLYVISTSLPDSGKEWKSFPRMVLALDVENRRLKTLGLKPEYRATSFNIEYLDEADRAFLRKFER